ncbi:MAG: hypothetical protein CL843_09420 [Crocinitomicaceae bacterium]|nr:hypothetical protein [Crocinitomicaceae bacterium]|tara:strand:+ start:6799 stop:8097 length:1299 start_codon:yes stop_codon:yes gene_type:complete
MPRVEKEKLKKVFEHNRKVAAGSMGSMKPTEVRDIVEKDMEDLSRLVHLTRSGKAVDSKGNQVPADDVSLSVAVKNRYGFDSVNQYLKSIGIYTNAMTLNQAARQLGHDNLTESSLENLLISNSSIALASDTSEVPSEYRFIIPELFMEAIRIGYEHSSLNQNWIANTIQLTQKDVKMPQIKRGNMTPRRIGEAESIPFGSLQFGLKSASTFKIGIGYKITDELVASSRIDMMNQSLRELGNDMSIAADVEAINILINGEQEDGSESAPVIGVENTTNNIAYVDLITAVSRMRRLKKEPGRLITNEQDSIDINLLDEFKGFDGVAVLALMNSITKKLPKFENDLFLMPEDQIMLLNKATAMSKFKWIGMKMEKRRNPQTQEDEMFVSDYLGYGIINRDGRLIIDGSLAYASNGFPDYMDVDSRINQQFKTIN